MKHKLTTIIIILGINFSFSQNGKILSKKLIDLRYTEIWSKVSEKDQLISDFEYLDNLDFFQILYESDSITVRGYIIEPKIVGKYPVVIFNRGGNRKFGELDLSTMLNYTSKLAEKGYIIIASNYRDQDEFGGEDINDVLILTETIKELENADANRIGMFGWSRGGMMTYLALKNSEKISTAIVGNAPSDLFGVANERTLMETHVFSRCIPNYWKNKEDELKKRSAIYWPEELNKNSSLLILFGKNDDLVNPKQSVSLAKSLKNLNYNFELKEYDTDHYFSDKKQELNEVVIEWFNKKL